MSKPNIEAGDVWKYGANTISVCHQDTDGRWVITDEKGQSWTVTEQSFGEAFLLSPLTLPELASMVGEGWALEIRGENKITFNKFPATRFYDGATAIQIEGFHYGQGFVETRIIDPSNNTYCYNYQTKMAEIEGEKEGCTHDGATIHDEKCPECGEDIPFTPTPRKPKAGDVVRHKSLRFKGLVLSEYEDRIVIGGPSLYHPLLKDFHANYELLEDSP